MLAVATVFLVGFRVGLNVADSDVIDVGYSGVIGADRIGDGRSRSTATSPTDDQSGDTYGPVAYYAYVPFEQVFPWSGTWDDLPAAHAASIFFDLATIAALFLLGRRLRRGRSGTELGILLCLRLGRLPVHRLRAGVEHQRRAGLARAGRRPCLCLTSPIPRGSPSASRR